MEWAAKQEELSNLQKDKRMALERKATILPEVLLEGAPRGVCAGIERTLNAANEIRERYPNDTLYILGQPAHNTHINKRYQEKGFVFVNKVSEVPRYGKVLYGPHGTEIQQKKEGEERHLEVWDTVCPLVVKVEDPIEERTTMGIVTIYWGDPDHQEAKSALSRGDVILVRNKEEALSNELEKEVEKRKGIAFSTQTTFNADEAIEIESDLLKKYPNLITSKTPDRCFATRNRQQVIKDMIEIGDATFITIIGSNGSSNSRRLHEVALENNAESVFVDGPHEFNVELLRGHKVVGFESGASVEEEIFQSVVEKARQRFGIESTPFIVNDPEKVKNEERIRFAKVYPTKLPEFVYNN